MWWFNICIHYEMITKISLVTICTHTKLLHYDWPYSLCYILHPCGLFYKWKFPGWTSECKTQKSVGGSRNLGPPVGSSDLSPLSLQELISYISGFSTWPLVCMEISAPWIVIPSTHHSVFSVLGGSSLSCGLTSLP